MLDFLDFLDVSGLSPDFLGCSWICSGFFGIYLVGIFQDLFQISNISRIVEDFSGFPGLGLFWIFQNFGGSVSRDLEPPSVRAHTAKRVACRGRGLGT